MGRGRWMSSQKGGDHYEEQTASKGEDWSQCGVDAHKGVYKEKGEGLGRLPPGEEANGAILRNKSDSYPSVEAAEIGGHLR